MTRVYIVSNSGHDFSAASRFGELVVLNTGTVRKYAITKMLRLFEPILDSNPRDFILQSGPTVMNCVACSMFAAIHSRLNLLLYSQNGNGEERYVVRRIVFEGKEGDAQWTQ